MDYYAISGSVPWYTFNEFFGLMDWDYSCVFFDWQITLFLLFVFCSIHRFGGINAPSKVAQESFKDLLPFYCLDIFCAVKNTYRDGANAEGSLAKMGQLKKVTGGQPQLTLIRFGRKHKGTQTCAWDNDHAF